MLRFFFRYGIAWLKGVDICLRLYRGLPSSVGTCASAMGSGSASTTGTISDSPSILAKTGRIACSSVGEESSSDCAALDMSTWMVGDTSRMFDVSPRHSPREHRPNGGRCRTNCPLKKTDWYPQRGRRGKRRLPLAWELPSPAPVLRAAPGRRSTMHEKADFRWETRGPSRTFLGDDFQYFGKSGWSRLVPECAGHLGSRGDR